MADTKTPGPACRICHVPIRNPGHWRMGVCANCVMESHARAAARPLIRPGYRFNNNGKRPDQTPHLD